jgi:hypothetical protein
MRNVASPNAICGCGQHRLQGVAKQRGCKMRGHGKVAGMPFLGKAANSWRTGGRLRQKHVPLPSPQRAALIMRHAEEAPALLKTLLNGPARVAALFSSEGGVLSVRLARKPLCRRLHIHLCKAKCHRPLLRSSGDRPRGTPRSLLALALIDPLEPSAKTSFSPLTRTHSGANTIEQLSCMKPRYGR